jgi:predicted nucleic acid-binding protein
VIVADSSVWVGHLNNQPTPQVRHLRSLVGRTAILVGDLILLEILQGLRDDREAALVERALRRFEVAPMLDPDLAVRAAANDRLL